MSFKLGNTTIGELYVGSNKIAQAYLGSNLVYQAAAPGPTFDSVTIGTQTWMSKNLDIDDGGEGITIINNVTVNGVNFGTVYYYTWDAAVRIANSIKGWHLPTKDEWNKLISTVGGGNAGDKLKSTSGWNDDGNGTDDFGFTVLPVGRESAGSLSQLGRRGFFWTNTEYTSTNAYYTLFLNTTSNNLRLVDSNKSYGYSIRLIKD